MNRRKVVETILVEAEGCGYFLIIDIHILQSLPVDALVNRGRALQPVMLDQFHQILLIKLNARPETNLLKLADFRDSVRLIIGLRHVAQSSINILPFIG